MLYRLGSMRSARRGTGSLSGLEILAKGILADGLKQEGIWMGFISMLRLSKLKTVLWTQMANKK